MAKENLDVKISYNTKTHDTNYTIRWEWDTVDGLSLVNYDIRENVENFLV